MFLGHYAVAFAAKGRYRPFRSARSSSRRSSSTASGRVLLLGLEHVEIAPGNTAVTPLKFVDYPITHSLLMCAVWAALFGVAYYLVRRYRAGALTVAALVMSHWILDFVSHRPDLPLYPGGGTYAGLGLWQSLPATLAVEGTMFVAGLWLYLA